MYIVYIFTSTYNLFLTFIHPGYTTDAQTIRPTHSPRRCLHKSRWKKPATYLRHYIYIYILYIHKEYTYICKTERKISSNLRWSTCFFLYLYVWNSTNQWKPNKQLQKTRNSYKLRCIYVYVCCKTAHIFSHCKTIF